jgi:hypothetical protein
MADAFGIVGMIVAPLLSVIFQILWNRLINRRAVQEGVAQISDLKERQAYVLETIKTMDEPPPLFVINSMDRLSLLIEKAEPILQSVLPDKNSEPETKIAVQPGKGERDLHSKT